MGAPNLVRGGSHSGNVATAEAAQAGVLDVLSSDYVPASLLMAALILPQSVPAIDLPAALRTVTRTPAEAVGLSDRGEIAVGKRADLVRIRLTKKVPVVRSVWRMARRGVGCAPTPPARRPSGRAGWAALPAPAGPAREPCLDLRAPRLGGKPNSGFPNPFRPPRPGPT